MTEPYNIMTKLFYQRIEDFANSFEDSAIL